MLVPHWPCYGRNEKALQLLASNITAIGDNDRSKGINFIIQDLGLFDRK